MIATAVLQAWITQQEREIFELAMRKISEGDRTTELMGIWNGMKRTLETLEAEIPDLEKKSRES